MLADKESREAYSDTEWKLNPKLFDCLVTLWGTVSVDLFASRLNYQLKPFLSWRPDPEVMAIDAFSLDWREQYLYAFPPFSLINRVLQKVEQDQSQGIIIVPMWNTQVWFPRLLHLLIDFPVTLPKGRRTLLLPFNREKHTLFTRSSPFWLQIIRNSLTARGISQKAAKVILKSWRETTHKQYSVYLRKWLLFCSSRGFDPYKATPAQALDFITDLF